MARNLLGSVVGLAVGALTHPIGTAGKVLGTAKAAAGFGLTVVGRVLEQLAEQAETPAAPSPAPSPAPTPSPAPSPPADSPSAPVEPAPEPTLAPMGTDDSLEPPATVEPEEVTATPADLAEVVAKKAPTKKAPAKKAPANKATAKKAAATKAPATKATAKKAPAKKAPAATESPTSKASDEKSAQGSDQVPLGDDREMSTPVGTTGSGEDTNPDTTDTDLQGAGTGPLVDPAVAEAVRNEADVLRKAAESNPAFEPPSASET